MKFMKRAKIYQASNVTFNPETIEARSYSWWIFVKKIGNNVVFNNYGYSISTRKHQSKVKQLLRQLGINIDMEIEAPRGLQDLDSALEHYAVQIKNLEAAIHKPRSNKAKNEERLKEIEFYRGKMRQVGSLF